METLTERIEAWFLNQYYCNYLTSCLNTGTAVDPDWEPHVGQREQAKANAELLIRALRFEPVKMPWYRAEALRHIAEPNEVLYRMKEDGWLE